MSSSWQLTTMWFRACHTCNRMWQQLHVKYLHILFMYLKSVWLFNALNVYLHECSPFKYSTSIFVLGSYSLITVTLVTLSRGLVPPGHATGYVRNLGRVAPATAGRPPCWYPSVAGAILRISSLAGWGRRRSRASDRWGHSVLRKFSGMGENRISENLPRLFYSWHKLVLTESKGSDRWVPAWEAPRIMLVPIGRWRTLPLWEKAYVRNLGRGTPATAGDSTFY